MCRRALCLLHTSFYHHHRYINKKKYIKLCLGRYTLLSRMSTSAVTPTVLSQVYHMLKQKHARMLFYVSRTADDKCILYHHTRYGDRLLDPGVTLHSNHLSDPLVLDEIPTLLRDNFFGVDHGPVLQKRGVYKMTIRAIPERSIQLRLKKSGDVVPYATISGTPNIRLLNVHMDLNFNAIGMPHLKGITLTGVNVASGEVLQEFIAVTEEMLQQWDAVSLFKAFMQSR